MSHKCDKMKEKMKQMKLSEQMQEITLKVLAILGLVSVTYPFLIALFLWVMVK